MDTKKFIETFILLLPGDLRLEFNKMYQKMHREQKPNNVQDMLKEFNTNKKALVKLLLKLNFDLTQLETLRYELYELETQAKIDREALDESSMGIH